VISVITVGNAVQIKRSRLSSVYFNYLSRIPGHAASRCAGPATWCNIIYEDNHCLFRKLYEIHKYTFEQSAEFLMAYVTVLHIVTRRTLKCRR
jgi:hypothetical protein